MNLEVKVLSTVEVSVDERKVSFGDRKQPLAAALLALEPGVVRRETLTTSLWDEEKDPDKARPLLDTCVKGIRKGLDDAVPGAGKLLMTHRSLGYQLKVHTENVDYHRFRRLSAAAKAAVSFSSEEAVELGGRALAEWGPSRAGLRGPIPFGGYSPYSMRAWTGKLRDEYRRTLLGHLLARLKCGLLDDLAPELDRLALDEDGAVDEELARHRMVVHYRMGDKTAAVNAFEHLRQAMEVALKTSPSARTLDLLERIMKNDRTLRLVRNEQPAASSGRPGGAPGQTGDPRHRTGRAPEGAGGEPAGQDPGPDQDTGLGEVRRRGVFGDTHVTGAHARVIQLGGSHATYNEAPEPS
ncbi:BTAD domain-containing putative transcriptional regulator [Sphaerisporangium sp. NPDC005288]|uniref:AfsR/SARP family transcriptional regulator n=1 Tax=Sphaerisporangium sp. NPDC005288 TaxID=3155114 RepID=UPI0033B00B6A